MLIILKENDPLNSETPLPKSFWSTPLPDAKRPLRQAFTALVTEDLVENQTIEWFKEIGYSMCGYDLAFDGVAPEREDYTSVIPKVGCQLCSSNPDLPQYSIEHALRELLNPNTPGCFHVIVYFMAG